MFDWWLLFAHSAFRLFQIRHDGRLIQILTLPNLPILVDIRSSRLGRADFRGDGSNRRRALPAGLRCKLVLHRLMEGSPRSRGILRPLQIAISYFQMAVEFVIVFVLRMRSPARGAHLLRGLATNRRSSCSSLDEDLVKAKRRRPFVLSLVEVGGLVLAVRFCDLIYILLHFYEFQIIILDLVS